MKKSKGIVAAGIALALLGASKRTLEPADAPRILAAVRAPGAQVVLVNVWATWCAPCREEFPDLLRLRKAYLDRGLRMVLVSADFESQEAQRFLAEQGVDFPSYIKDGDDMKFIDGLDKKWSGAMPSTFVYDSSGKLVDFREGKASYETLEKAVRDVLDSHPGPGRGPVTKERS
jgi:thiol-disulfide isomerase/thioredoxin